MSDRIPKHKAAKLLERAQHHLAAGQYPDAEALLREVARSELRSPQVAGLLGEALAAQGKDEEAFEVWGAALSAHPNDPELHGRVGAAHSARGRYAQALPHLERAQAERRREPGTLVHLGFVYLELGRAEDAERVIGKAISSGAGPEARLVLAALRGRQGRYPDAERLCREVAQGARSPQVVDSAQGLLADARLLQGDAPGALALWRELRARGQVDPAHLAHMAYAAQLCSEPGLADQLISERSASGNARAEDLLLFAQIANLRARPEQALELLAQAEAAEGARHPGHGFEVAATRGRSLRLAGRREDAKAALLALADAPEAKSARLGPKVRVDLGHLAAEEGDFLAAEGHFRAALEMDPQDPEAQHGLQLTGRRVAWRDELEASAEAKVEAARAEAEALKRRFSAREGELEQLRAELERVRAQQQDALEKARRAEEEARAAAERARADQQQKLREELALREVEADEKARVNVEAALGEAVSRCPRAVMEGFLVAERTFQKALYTDLPAAAVAVLYAGALERALYTLFVDRFRTWLKGQGRLEDFLRGATRERRGTRVEYFDHFVEAFDEERPGRAPSMGEVGRVLAKRHELYLRRFDEYLRSTWGEDDAFFDALAQFVQRTKEELRDPVAHGRGDAVGYDLLRRFREQLYGTILSRIIPPA